MLRQKGESQNEIARFWGLIPQNLAISKPTTSQKLTRLQWLGNCSRATNDAGETYLIDAKTIRSVEYPKTTNGFFSVPPQTATYRETWVRSVKESKITGQYLWLFDCRGSVVVMSSPAGDITARAKSTGVESLLQRIPPDTFYEMVQTRVCKK